ncbi:hypothetical protein [Sulfuracidifex tepidarius]|uniref:Uncharacterized protein n=1 Tax=Sulfuracidifex tepidarius TaxID=1294262 RepID=A0A510DYK1_9CREN|nr:hypothetical protein [Sulfuracidifex tepidarius]BBG25295.1 hypothetical protein IC006_2630 [Sulfuracidifex tepidarius]BBG28089.1 hypothetical protein IC007_2644 [Sulfuracidifex tepidarius]
MQKKAIAFSDDGYYIVEINGEEVMFRRAKELDFLYYVSFLSLLPIVIVYALTSTTWVLGLIFLPFLFYLTYLRLALTKFTPENVSRLLSVETKKNIIKINSEAKTFIMQKGRHYRL